MKHSDYQSQIRKDRIIFDEDLNIDKLGWKHGDYFKVTNINGVAQLVKVDPLTRFIDGVPPEQKNS